VETPLPRGCGGGVGVLDAEEGREEGGEEVEEEVEEGFYRSRAHRYAHNRR
jgi:hypothetical protein